MHKFYASGTILYRGSTLLAVLIVQPLILMITESPDRIGVTQSWSSHYTPSEYSHQMYSSLWLPVMLLVSSLFCPFDKSYCILFFLLCKEFFCEIFSKCFPKYFILIFRSRIYISFRFRMDTDRYVRSCVPLQQYRISSAQDKALYVSPG